MEWQWCRKGEMEIICFDMKLTYRVLFMFKKCLTGGINSQRSLRPLIIVWRPHLKCP